MVVGLLGVCPTAIRTKCFDGSTHQGASWDVRSDTCAAIDTAPEGCGLSVPASHAVMLPSRSRKAAHLKSVLPYGTPFTDTERSRISLDVSVPVLSENTYATRPRSSMMFVLRACKQRSQAWVHRNGKV